MINSRDRLIAQRGDFVWGLCPTQNRGDFVRGALSRGIMSYTPKDMVTADNSTLNKL